MAIKEKYQCRLTLQFLNGVEYQNGEIFDTEEALEAQDQTQDKLEEFCSKNNIRLSCDWWDGNTSLEDGYVESLDFEIETDLNSDVIMQLLEEFRRDITYCKRIEYR